MDFCLITSVLLLLICSTGGDSAGLTVVPGSTVPLDTLVQCTCEGTGDDLQWIVESNFLSHAVKQQRDISVTDSHSGSNLSSVLTIPALPVNDGVAIGCLINPMIVGTSQLAITGVSPVEDLRVGFTSDNSLHLTWSPPVFYSNDVPGGSTITYQVLITNETGDPIVDTTVSTTSLMLSNITACDTFNVSMTALYAQYTSANSSVQYNGSLLIDIEGYSVKLNQVPILLRVTCTPTQCNGTVLIEPYCDGHNVSTHQLTVNGLNDPVQLIAYTLTDLDPFRFYDISVKLMDSKNATRNEDFVSISTYHVQGLIISSSTDQQQQQQQYTNGSVRVKCLFIEGGSIADGCHVIFTSTTDQAIEPQAFNITGSNERIVILSVSGNYTVTAYDLVNGTIIGPSVEYSTPVEVIILPVPPPVSATSSISSSSSSISVISSKATSSTISVTSVSVSPTVASNTPQATDGTAGNLTVFTAIAIVCVILLLLLVSGVGVILAVCLVTKTSRKKQATVTTNGEMALCYQPHADTNDYMEHPQLTNVLFNNEETVPDSPAPDQSTPTVPLVEDPYFVHRHEFVPPAHPPAATNIMEQFNIAPLAASHHTSSAVTEYIPHDNGATANSKHLYAELTPANKEKVPHKPPAGDTSVQYSTAAGHTNEGGITTYPMNECSPPPKYENINQLSSPVEQESSATSQYVPTIPPPLSMKGNTVVHNDYESQPVDSEVAIDYSCSSEEAVTRVTVNSALPAMVTGEPPNKDDREGVIISCPITASDSLVSNAMWQFKSAASPSSCQPYIARYSLPGIVPVSPIEDAPVVENMKSSNDLFASELVTYGLIIPRVLYGLSPLEVVEETHNLAVTSVTGKSEVMKWNEESDEEESDEGESDEEESDEGESDEGESDEGESDEVAISAHVVWKIIKAIASRIRNVHVSLRNLQRKSVFKMGTLRPHIPADNLKLFMYPISIPCLFSEYYLRTAHQLEVPLTIPTSASSQLSENPYVVPFRPKTDKGRHNEIAKEYTYSNKGRQWFDNVLSLFL